MTRKHILAALIIPGFLISGCSTDDLWPSFLMSEPEPLPVPTKTAESSTQKEVNDQSAPKTSAKPPALNSTNFVPPKVTPGQQTGTFVGQKVQMLRGELRRMQSEINRHNKTLQNIRKQTQKHAQKYHASVAAINSRLQVGTTPGNPFLVNQWNVSQQQLAQIDGDIGKMNALANSVAGTSTMSSYLLETTRAAYGLTGAVEEDHRQLAILEDEVNRTVVLIDRLLNELSEDISRQSTYMANERSNLTTLSLAIKNGELLGQSLSNRAYASAPIAQGIRSNRTVSKRSPLVVIRFDSANVDYKQALYNAVNRALQRKPDAGFDIVAVASGQGSPAQVTIDSNKAKRNAEAVLRSLSEMGLPLQRVRLSSSTSNAARTNEVHVFVR